MLRALWLSNSSRELTVELLQEEEKKMKSNHKFAAMLESVSRVLLIHALFEQVDSFLGISYVETESLYKVLIPYVSNAKSNS